MALGCGTTGDANLFTDKPDLFNREIIFDLDLGAFYLYDLGHTGMPGVLPTVFTSILG